MSKNRLAPTIRMKKLGLLIRDARMAKGISPAECARALDITDVEFQSYEYGENAPSLPELEALAYWLDVPLEQFWANQVLSVQSEQKKPHLRQLTALRQRIIGVLLRRTRMQVGLSVADLAEQAQLPVDQLEAYELGEMAIPLPELENLCTLLNCPLERFHDQHGRIGDWLAKQREQKLFMSLSPELRTFVSDPNNLTFIEAAKHLSELPSDTLRQLSESLLMASHGTTAGVDR
jgi:transcriptional regulator with XRE-family HTH domain